ncbi:MAG: YkgJ family cysteine cluster protein [Sedimentisphaerales bacterium]|nr:YkgJ family cysteine cluster protein [Sedimentisphaerales bacterium]
MNDDNKYYWYAAGLHFECLQCGRCCSGPAEGYIWVSRPEIKLIARYLNMSAGDLKKRFLRRVGLRMTIIEDVHTRDCIFLKTANAGRQCSIYPVRPSQCRTWPFWTGNLSSPGCWNTAGQKCPGINRGSLYSFGQIQSKRDNTRWWQNEQP